MDAVAQGLGPSSDACTFAGTWFRCGATGTQIDAPMGAGTAGGDCAATLATDWFLSCLYQTVWHIQDTEEMSDKLLGRTKGKYFLWHKGSRSYDKLRRDYARYGCWGWEVTDSRKNVWPERCGKGISLECVIAVDYKFKRIEKIVRHMFRNYVVQLYSWWTDLGLKSTL